MYEGDSFFTLTLAGQAGLAVLSLVLTAAMVLLTLVAAPGRRVWFRVLVAVGLFHAFVWLSPQVYYTYYRAIIPGLPLQWVIGQLPGVEETARLLLFMARDTLSDHGKGVMGWVMLLAALAPTRLFRRTAAQFSDSD